MDQIKIKIINRLFKIINQIENIKDIDDNLLILNDIDYNLDILDDLIINKDLIYINKDKELDKKIKENIYFEKMFKDLSPFFLIYNIANNISNKNIIKDNV